MGLVYADFELIQGDDLALASKYIIGSDEIRSMNIGMLLDTGSIMLCIKESIQEYMQFRVVDKRQAITANGQINTCDVVSGVELRFENRSTSCRAMVLPGNCEPLFGAIPMEDMDVLVHPQRQELVVHPDHPYMAQMTL